MTTTRGVENGGLCFGILLEPSAQKPKSTSSAVRIIKKGEQMLIPNGVDRHFPVFHMNILSFCIKGGGGIRGKVYRVALIIHAYQRPQLLDSLS